MEPSDSSEDELESIYDTLKDDKKIRNVNINDGSSVNVHSSDKNSSKLDERFKGGSLLRSSNNSSLESINFPVTPRGDVTNNSIILPHSQSESTTGGVLDSDTGKSYSPIITDNLNQENLKTIHIPDGGSGEIENEQKVGDNESLNQENFSGIHLPQINEGSGKQFSDKDQLGSSSNYDDQSINIQTSQENLSLGSHQEQTETCNRDIAKQDFQDSEILKDNLKQEKINDIQEIENSNGKIPNLQDELFLGSVINSNGKELNSPDTQDCYLGKDSSESPEDKGEIHNGSIIDQDAEQENEHGAYPLESLKNYSDQVLSLEVRASPRSQSIINNSATENNIFAMLNENNEPKSELANDFQVGSLDCSGDQSTDFRTSHDKELNLELEGSLQIPNESSNNVIANNYLLDAKLINDNSTPIQDDTGIQQENNTNELLVGSLFNSSDSNINYKISPRDDLNLETRALSPKDNISQNDLNIRDQEELQGSLNTTLLIEDNISKSETKIQEEFQFEPPGYNNEYDPDIPGSEITVKNSKEENSNSGELLKNTGQVKHEETDLNQVEANSEISLPQEVRLEGLKFNEIANETVNKENAKNKPVLQKDYTEEPEEPKPKTSVRSLITRALENSPETIVQRSETKNVETRSVKAKTVEDKRDKGTEKKTSKSSLQNLAPFANRANGAPCSMAATISGLILPRLK